MLNGWNIKMFRRSGLTNALHTRRQQPIIILSMVLKTMCEEICKIILQSSQAICRSTIRLDSKQIIEEEILNLTT